MPEHKLSFKLSGSVIFAFDSATDLQRLCEVLERGLESNTLFNEDVADLVERLRAVLNTWEDQA